MEPANVTAIASPCPCRAVGGHHAGNALVGLPAWRKAGQLGRHVMHIQRAFHAQTLGEGGDARPQVAIELF
jgi:hypothetical protein